jgi:hypothetical protein
VSCASAYRSFCLRLHLLVALLGATPLGHAAGRAVHAVPPFAARAGFAKFAGTADNAKRLARHKASTAPKAGDIPVLGANGKLPASIGAVGPAGPQGPAGSRGPAGPKGEKGDDGKPATSLWAAVKADGTLIKGQGVASVIKDAGFTGHYTVTFTQDVSSCAVLADQTKRVVRNSTAEAVGGAVVKVETYVPIPPVFAYQDGDFAIAVFC